MRKPAFCICDNKRADQLHGHRVAAVIAQLISAFVFATWIVKSLLSKSEIAVNYSPVCLDVAQIKDSFCQCFKQITF